MRSLETGRPLLRATNTGISALIDRDGAILARSGLLEQAIVRGEVQPMTGSTPFVRWGNALVVGLMLISLGLGGLVLRLRR